MLIGIATGLTTQSAPFILGQATVGATLSLSAVTLTGDSPVTYSVQWLRDGSQISGATSAEYTTAEADVDAEITVALTLPDASTLSSSNAVRIAAPAANVAPVIVTPATVAVTDQGDTVRYRFTEPGVTGTSPITLNARLTLDGVDVTAEMDGLTYTAAKTSAEQTLSMTFTASNGIAPDASATLTRTVPAASAGDVAPAFTSAPSIAPASGAIGTTFTVSEGVVSGTPAPTLTGVLTLDGVDVTAQMDGLNYTATAAGALLWQVTASNSEGSTTADASASVSASISTVDLSAATTSLRFPPGNDLSASTPDHLKLALSQDTTGLPRLLTLTDADTHHSAYVFAVRLPVPSRRTDESDTFEQYYLMGDRDHFVTVWGNGNIFAMRDYQYASEVTVPWETAVIFAMRYTDVDGDGDPHNQIFAVNPETGEVLEGGQSQTFAGSEWNGEYRIGHSGDDSGDVGITEAWSGEMAWAAHVIGPLIAREALGSSDQHEYIKRIAQGEDIQDVLYDIEADGYGWGYAYGPYMSFYRDFDGTTASLSASHVAVTPVPAANTAVSVGTALRDTSATTALVAGGVTPGTDFMPRDGKLLGWKTVGVPGMANPPAIAPGYVRGLVPGATSADVEFTGIALGYSGDVEIRLIYADTGNVALDWTTVGTISSGEWSGTVTVPKSSDGWVVTQFRVGGEIWNHRDIWGVGYKALQLGQSQTKIYLYSDDGLSSMTDGAMGTVSRAIGDRIHMIGPRNMFDSMNIFVDQLRVLEPKVPFMLVEDAVNGTSQEDLIDDSATERNWSDLQTTLDTWGNDVSVILKNWGTNEMNRSDSAYRAILDGMIKGTGTAAHDHSFDAALQPGYVFAFSPLTRHTRGRGASDIGSYAGNASSARSTEANYAQTNAETNPNGLPDMIVGPPVSDFMIESGGGPHQEVAGSIVMGARMAMTLVKAIGGTIPDQPVFTGTATLGDDGTTITVPVTLPNGGTLTALSPNAIRSFGVSTDGGSTWVVDGHTAAISGASVVLTKDSGTWPASNLQVKYYSNGEDRPTQADAAAEDEILRGMLYETTPDALPLPIIDGSPDTIQGMPVMGIMSNGVWSPNFVATVTAG